MAAADARAAAVGPDDVSDVLFTSGTTGRSKGVLCKAGILACLQSGATLTPQLTFDAERALRAVAEHRITVPPGPPTIYQMLLDHPARSG